MSGLRLRNQPLRGEDISATTHRISRPQPGEEERIGREFGLFKRILGGFEELW